MKPLNKLAEVRGIRSFPMQRTTSGGKHNASLNQLEILSLEPRWHQRRASPPTNAPANLPTQTHADIAAQKEIPDIFVYSQGQTRVGQATLLQPVLHCHCLLPSFHANIQPTDTAACCRNRAVSSTGTRVSRRDCSQRRALRKALLFSSTAPRCCRDDLQASDFQ